MRTVRETPAISEQPDALIAHARLNTQDTPPKGEKTTSEGRWREGVIQRRSWCCDRSSNEDASIEEA
jgi:hypothetical protein